MFAAHDNTVVQRGRPGDNGSSGSRKHFVISMREPWYLPDDNVELPTPESLSGTAPTINWLASILPPVLMIGAMGALMAFTGFNAYMIMMPLMSMAFPIVNVVSYFSQKKEYKKKLVSREQHYRAALVQTRQVLDNLTREQRSILEREYPLLNRLSDIVFGSRRERLWWRRPGDPDFLSLRMGTGSGEPSFAVSPPRISDPNDQLILLGQELLTSYREIQTLPLLLELKKVGSVAVAEPEKNKVGSGYDLARRLILDVLVHHSPQDVQVAVIADYDDARIRWGWLKWAPHTQAILQDNNIRRLAFTSSTIDKCREWLAFEFNHRKNPEPGTRIKDKQYSIVVILDDLGEIRQSNDIKILAEFGHEVGIYLIFAGGRNWPRECRARVDSSGEKLTYIETWSNGKNNRTILGTGDGAKIPECERIARALAGLDLSAGMGSSDLPENVRLYDLLEISTPSVDEIKQNWQKTRPNDELLQFSFGFRSGRKGIEDVKLNLLPEELGGSGSYHTILVGTTGSGKSEFMKSLVLANAYKYSPKTLNFFFMDFKGGAAFNDLKDLPHVVGVVTNLGPELVERGLSAMEAEIDRRQKRFADESVPNIWAYNANHPEEPIPHLLLLLDEFARGIEGFQRLPGMLDRLVRQGRSLGMYLLLANQDVNAAVDRLLNNIGWRIALKVARQDEMHIIDRSLPVAKRPGQGYILSTNNEPIEFQSAFSGFRVIDSRVPIQDAFKIFKVDSEGKWTVVHSNAGRVSVSDENRSNRYEGEYLIDTMRSVAAEIEHSRPIYLDPLEERISLEYIFEQSSTQKVFNGVWTPESNNDRFLTPVGFLDFPRECLQDVMTIDFNDQDGHLWIVGAPGSGKSMTLETILLSLALTNTPEQVQFYILEFGAGRLLKFETLPHTGAVIRLTDPDERLTRLLNFLNDEMDRRMAHQEDEDGRHVNLPAIFVVINNFAEMRTNYSDQAERISRIVRDGNAVGLHVIITTNRKVELGRLVIARRIVLRLANRDEYMDAVGKMVQLSSAQAEGRGVWVVDQRITECQIAQPTVKIGEESNLQDAKTICHAMQKEWHGSTPKQIEVLPSFISFTSLMEKIKSTKNNGISIPVGVSFESMELIAPELLREIPRWLVLGPPRSGKSNFLICMVNAVLAQDPKAWKIYFLSLLRSPSELEKDKIRIAASSEDIIQACAEIVEGFDAPAEEVESARKSLVLIDDLGKAFEQGREPVVAALNNLALKAASHEDVVIVGAGLADELRLRQNTSDLVRTLKASRTGLSLSKDSNDLDWFGAQVPLQYRRMDLPSGRGFWVSSGKALLVQLPWAGKGRPR